MSKDEQEIDVSSCVFRVKDSDGTEILVTPDYKRAFQLKQLHPGSAVFVEATVDVGMNMDPSVLQAIMGNATGVEIDDEA